MAEPEVQIAIPSTPGARDVEMAGGDVEILEVVDTNAVEGEDTPEEIEEEAVSPRVTFVDYLRSPIIELLVGQGDSTTLLTAHQALLVRSPFFASAVQAFTSEATTRRIEFANEDIDAVGCMLQFLYTGEYYPRKLGEVLEPDDTPTETEVGDEGAHLLKHARVYTLAEKLGMLDLKALAHSKVHRVNSTAKGEIEYARYVYANTPRDDATIRKPIASFWGQRSHVLRHEAEDDFKRLCLEFPEFGFDVLSHVLDARERRTSDRVAEEPKSGRKRQRQI